MNVSDLGLWNDLVRRTLQRYGEPLLRDVAGRLVKPRNQWPVEELLDRSLATLGNVAVVDRRLEELPPAAGKLLAVMGVSRQPRWKLGHLIEVLMTLQRARQPVAVEAGAEPVAEAADGPKPDAGLDPIAPLLALFDAGLLYPDLDPVRPAAPADGQPVPPPPTPPPLTSFAEWVGLSCQPTVIGFARVFTHPEIAERARQRIDLGLPDCPAAAPGLNPVHEADGLEWPLRLSVLWQQIAAGPLRRTMQGDFFKRDLDRLRKDPLLTAPPADALGDLPDAGLLTVAVAERQGLVTEVDGELRAGSFPASWAEGTWAALTGLWTDLTTFDSWNPLDGWRGGQPGSTPFPSAYLLAHLLLAKLPDGAWAAAEDVEDWIHSNHPFWASDTVRPSKLKRWVETFLLGFSFQARFVQATKAGDGRWLVRLSAFGRWLLGIGDKPPPPPSYAQTLMVQPNLEIVAYRQGLTPGLIAQLARLAAWKSLGAACTLQLEPDSVYRALQAGETFDSLVRTLERHGIKAVPPAVQDMLRTWANKHERITIYPSATLFEFGSAEELNEALARGLPAVRLSDRLAVVAGEQNVDFRHYRLSGTRDYSLPPEKCVTVDADGVTLTVDLTRSDLLLDIEIQRFAELVDRGAGTNKRVYRITPASLATARAGGMNLRLLEEWFAQRCGQAASAAAKLLMIGDQGAPIELRRQTVVHFGNAEAADGVVQWPGTRSLVGERLGPTSVALPEEHLEVFRERLAGIGIRIKE